MDFWRVNYLVWRAIWRALLVLAVVAAVVGVVGFLVLGLVNRPVFTLGAIGAWLVLASIGAAIDFHEEVAAGPEKPSPQADGLSSSEPVRDPGWTREG